MVHIGLRIKEELKNQRRSVKWLADNLYCDRTNIYKIFQKDSIDTLLLYRISKILSYDFFKEYSQDL
ncbi:MAG: XRE family transcriptional regulator [Bacteroidales bacterium]|nr:XRE family transcriptional regulator [Bacteroidales bacterium]MBR2476322.1 XRE family transcriptional regulator [Bacteroidaceae bacterium]MBR3608336.1 XRE family transcriptional regulator [Bacteroidales bacterium]